MKDTISQWLDLPCYKLTAVVSTLPLLRFELLMLVTGKETWTRLPALVYNYKVVLYVRIDPN